MTELDLYKNDNFGLKTLNEKGRLWRYSILGDHINYTNDDYLEILKNL